MYGIISDFVELQLVSSMRAQDVSDKHSVHIAFLPVCLSFLLSSILI